MELAGTRLAITDSAGATRTAPLFYVSPDQFNFQVPAGTAVGAAQVVIIRSDTVTSRGTLQISSVSPDLFTANSNGQGVAAATAIRLNPNGTPTAIPVFQCGVDPAGCVPSAISLDSGQVYLALYATGVRGSAASDVIVTIGGVSVPVLFAGPQPQFIGLDQVNVQLTQALRGRGTVEVRIAIGAVSSNSAIIAIQ